MKVSILVLATCLTPNMAMAQEWKAYSYADAGFAAQFPTAPTIEKGTFKAPTGMSLPMTRYAVQQAHRIYRVDVVDYSSSDADGPGTIAAVEKTLGAKGQVTAAVNARVNRAMGRELSITGTDGGRSAIALFFVDKRLYMLDAEALPPDALSGSGDMIRFEESLQFLGGAGGFGGPGGPGEFGGRFRGGFNNPQARQALAACAGKSADDAVRLNTPNGEVTATCTLVARPN